MARKKWSEMDPMERLADVTASVTATMVLVLLVIAVGFVVIAGGMALYGWLLK